MWTIQALIIFGVLLPGFVTRSIVGSLTAKKHIGDLSSIIESFIFSFFVYVLVLFLKPEYMVSVIQNISTTDFKLLLDSIQPLVFLSFSLSIVIGIAWSYIVNFDIAFKILRWMRATTSTARDSVWLDIFYDMRERFVLITLKDGKKIFGYPAYYSTDQKEGCIFLTEPEWFDDKNKTYKSLNVKGVLLTKNEGIRKIEFLKTEKE